MVARGWISATAVSGALFPAADACGLNKDDGDSRARTIPSGLDDGQKHPHLNLAHDFTRRPSSAIPEIPHGRSFPPQRLIMGILPETGAALMSDSGDVQDRRYVRLHHG
jgi:hypothetical protein